jgi:voltage-gated potassium channel
VADFVSRPTGFGLLWFIIVRLNVAVAVVVSVFVLATAGYVRLEHFDVLQATFMSMITLSTVGYAEVKPLDRGGEIFTMVVIVAGFAAFVYAAAMLTNLFTSGEAAAHLKQARGRRMRQGLSDHVIVIGFGRVGQAASSGLSELHTPCLVLERDPRREEAIAAAGFVPMIGDGTSEDVLVEAGIHRARALIAAAEDDSVNLILALTARSIRRDLRIVSRVNEPAWQARIEAAGADLARSPYGSYGLALAAQALTPGVLDLHTVPSLGLTTGELEISPNSVLVGHSLGEVSGHEHEVFALGLRREREFHTWYDVSGPIEAGDVLVVLGPSQKVQELAERC